MNKLLNLACLLSLCALTACVSGARTSLDESNTYPAGKKIRGPRVNVGNFLGVTLLSIDTGLQSAFEEPTVVAGGSVLSKTGIEALNAATRSERGGIKTVGYNVKQAQTDVSTNAAPTVEALGGAAGKLINKAAGAP